MGIFPIRKRCSQIIFLIEFILCVAQNNMPFYSFKNGHLRTFYTIGFWPVSARSFSHRINYKTVFLKVILGTGNRSINSTKRSHLEYRRLFVKFFQTKLIILVFH